MARLLIWLVCGLLLGCHEAPPGYPARQVPAGLLTDAAARAAGQQLFRELCASCHGHPSEGRSERADFFRPPAPDFTTERYRHLDPAYLYWRIETGKNVEPFLSAGSVMPAWGPHLSPDQLWQLVAYLRQRAGS